MTETTKKVKAVKAVESTTAVEPVAKKPAKEKPVKPAKLKFEAVVSTCKISAGSVKEAFESLVPYVAEMLQDEHGGNSEDFAFLNNSQVLLDAMKKILAQGMDPTHYLDTYDIVDELPEMSKLFGKELKEVVAKIKAREAEEAAEEERAARAYKEQQAKAAELAKTYAPPVRLKKADIAKATQVLKDAGIEFIDA